MKTPIDLDTEVGEANDRTLPMKTHLAQSWGRTGLACAIGLAGVMLAGCAATSDPVQEVVAQKTGVQTADDIVSREISAETFTTEGKPTKTIETPWGPREIIDQQSLKETQQAAHNYMNELNNSDQVTKEASWQVLRNSMQIEQYDLLRIGCVSTIDSFCHLNTDYFAESCKEAHGFGQLDLNMCEMNNVEPVFRLALQRSACDINGSRHEMRQSFEDKDDLLDSLFVTHCRVWRGDPHWKVMLTKEVYLND